jgi:predicted nucleic acid-binding protein
MAWVVDTSVLLDIMSGDIRFEPASSACLQQHLSDGLLVCPITIIELGPAFLGDFHAAETYLSALSVEAREPWTRADSATAHRLWNDFQVRRRQQGIAKRPLADILIVAFASRFQGVITRNAGDFKSISSTLAIVTP